MHRRARRAAAPLGPRALPAAVAARRAIAQLAHQLPVCVLVGRSAGRGAHRRIGSSPSLSFAGPPAYEGPVLCAPHCCLASRQRCTTVLASDQRLQVGLEHGRVSGGPQHEAGLAGWGLPRSRGRYAAPPAGTAAAPSPPASARVGKAFGGVALDGDAQDVYSPSPALGIPGSSALDTQQSPRRMPASSTIVSKLSR